MTLRQATLKDASSLAAISIEVWLGTYLREGVNAFFAEYALGTFTPEYYASILADPDEQVIVSQNKTGIDGFIRTTRNSTPPVAGLSSTEIATFYVQPRHHGRGLGKALLTAALAQTDATPWLTTNAENTAAIGFYQANGFAIVGQTHFKIQNRAYLNQVLTLTATAPFHFPEISPPEA